MHAKLEPGARIGRYEVRGLLGRGGTATVYDAELVATAGFRKPVALKVMHAEGETPDWHVALREARLGARLQHPGLVDIYDVGVEGDTAFFAMERVDGGSLNARLRGGPLPVGEACALLAEVADALAYAHEVSFDDAPNGLVHLDVKPGNILLTRAGRPKLADFGISAARGRLSEEGAPVYGTPGYMSAAHFAGATPDAAMDLYALAVVLTTCLLGRRTPLGQQGAPAGSDVVAALDAVAPDMGDLVARLTDPAHPERILRARVLAELLRAHAALAPATTGRGDTSGRGGSSPGVGPPTGPSGPSDRTGPSGQPRPVGADEATLSAPPRARPTGTRAPVLLGREGLVDDVLAALSEPGARVALEGPAGVGKTAIAQAVAARLGLRVVTLDLAGARSPRDVAERTARALGVTAPAWEDADPGDAIALAWRPDGDVLLFADTVDRCGADGVAVLERLPEAHPRTRLLLTSRARVEGTAMAIPVPPLPIDDAVALFVRCARQVRPGFAVDDETLEVVRGICAALDGLPLAIELAAGRVAILAPHQLQHRLVERFRLLARPGRGAEDRHASLDAALRWSWDPLAAWEQAALCQLSVFRGGFTVEAAEAVLDLSAFPDAPWSVLVLESLVARALVTPLPAARPGSLRFGFLQTVHAYAAERLDAAEGEAARRRHADWVATLPGGTRPGERLPDEIRDEVPNLLVAAQNVVAAGWQARFRPILVERAIAWCGYALTSTVLGLASRALEAPMLDPALRVDLLRYAGQALVNVGRGEEALQVALQRVELLRDASPEVRADAWYTTANVALQASDYLLAETALAHYRDWVCGSSTASAGPAAADGSRPDAGALPPMPAGLLSRHAIVMVGRGDGARALATYDAAEARVHEMSPVDRMVHGSNRAWAILRFGGDAAVAQDMARRSVTIAQHLSIGTSETFARACLARALVERGAVDEARAEAGRAMEAGQACGATRMSLYAVSVALHVEARAGDRAALRRLLNQLGRLRAHCLDTDAQAVACDAAVRAWLKLGDVDAARALVDELGGIAARAAERGGAWPARAHATLRELCG